MPCTDRLLITHLSLMMLELDLYSCVSLLNPVWCLGCRLIGSDAERRIFFHLGIVVVFLWLLPQFSDAWMVFQFVSSWQFAPRVHRNFPVWQPGVFIHCDSPTPPWRQALLSSHYNGCCFINIIIIFFIKTFASCMFFLLGNHSRYSQILLFFSYWPPQTGLKKNEE